MTTQFNATALREAAGGLERIMDDMSTFTALRANSPGVGDFGAARLLEAAVNGRRDGVVGHADLLKSSLTELGKTVTCVADKFEAVDQNNAKNISTSLPERQR